MYADKDPHLNAKKYSWNPNKYDRFALEMVGHYGCAHNRDECIDRSPSNRVHTIMHTIPTTHTHTRTHRMYHHPLKKP